MKKRFLSVLLAVLFVLFSFSGCTQKDEVDSSENVTLGNVLIFGDSYSTFEGYIPQGFSTWYTKFPTNTDVSDVKQTWWHQVIKKTNSSLILNSSYSGSTICNTGYNGVDASGISFVGRMTALFANEAFKKENVNTVIVYGGLNDYWANSPRGSVKHENINESDLYYVYPALSYLLSSLKSNLPNARIIFIIEELIGQEMKNTFESICKYFSIEYIKPQNISKQNGHPDALGMNQLTEQIIAYLNANTN